MKPILWQLTHRPSFPDAQLRVCGCALIGDSPVGAQARNP
jgi:hypothetical protein